MAGRVASGFLTGLPQRTLSETRRGQRLRTPAELLLLLESVLLDRVLTSGGALRSSRDGDRGEDLLIWLADDQVARLNMLTGRLYLCLSAEAARDVISTGWGQGLLPGQQSAEPVIAVVVDPPAAAYEVLTIAQIVEASIRHRGELFST